MCPCIFPSDAYALDECVGGAIALAWPDRCTLRPHHQDRARALRMALGHSQPRGAATPHACSSAIDAVARVRAVPQDLGERSGPTSAALQATQTTWSSPSWRSHGSACPARCHARYPSPSAPARSRARATSEIRGGHDRSLSVGEAGFGARPVTYYYAA